MKTNCWDLPGGEGWEEEGTGGWDVGARIASLQALTKEQIGVDIPWMTYVEDIEMEEGICRVYAVLDEGLVLDVAGQHAPSMGRTRRAKIEPGRWPLYLPDDKDLAEG